MRMMRVLIRHGVSFEDLFQLIDAEGRGIIEKDQFVHVIKDFGLPFTVKEISSFAQLYSVSDEHMDYEAFLQEIISNIEPFVDGDESFTSHQPHLDPNLYGKIMRDLYRMLHDSKSRLHKSIDDIYRMFSCWDHSGKGTVTSTQFFRVLSQMHVTFSDDDQDFIVELLDVNREGKINFDGLLSYCFDTGPLDDETAHGSGGASHQHGDESVASLEGGSTVGGTVNAADLRSVTSGNAAKRPHTAAAFRTNLYGHHNDRYQDDGDSYTTSFGMSSPIGVAVGGNRGSSSPLKPLIKRPTTASARVSHTGSSAGNGNERRVKPTELRQSWQRGEDGNNFILEVSSGSDNEEMGVSDKWSSGVRNEARHEGRPLSRTNEHSEPYNRTHTRYETDSSSSLNGMTPKFFQKPNDFRRSVSGNDVEQDHAQRKLTILRSAVLERHTKHGLHLKEIFDMFDKRCIRYIDAGDLMTTSQEFKVDISFEESKSLVKRIALDGVDRVSFSEFAIWITDPDHIALQTNIQIQIAEQLEQQGREYQYLIFRVLSQGHATDATHNDPSKLSPSPATCGLVSVGAFVEALQTIGLKLSDADITRTILRFDTHGSNQCSVSRFMRMAQNNMHWKDTLETLAFHEEAVEEAQVVRHRLHSSNRRAIPANIDEETLDMAEYLGIRVLSEPHLLWIVDEAIKAPLPANWTIHQDNDGRTFFYNTNTHSTRWDHPADPELRKLRDHHRKQ
jgi:Ca2+-binding EF-hand superfamily protein